MLVPCRYNSDRMGKTPKIIATEWTFPVEYDDEEDEEFERLFRKLDLTEEEKKKEIRRRKRRKLRFFSFKDTVKKVQLSRRFGTEVTVS